MTVDDLKRARDGHLWWGRADQPRPPYIRPVFEYLGKSPRGGYYTSDGAGGAIEWGPVGGVGGAPEP